MVSTNERMVNVSNCTQYCWPFPAECPPKPWTPEQIKEYNKQQRQQVPEAPMVSQ